MMRILISVCLLLSSSLLARGAVAADNPAHYREMTVNGGAVNWTTGKISAEGYGLAPMTNNTKAAPLLACRAAVVDAQRNLLESTQGVRVTATTVINNYMLNDDEVKSSIEGIVRAAQLVSREPDNTGGCKVVLEMPMRGDASSAIYRRLARNQNDNAFNLLLDRYKKWQPVFFSYAHASEDVPQQKAEWEQAFELLSKRLSSLESQLLDNKRALASTPIAAAEGPSGLVVDARGSNFIPSLNPKIRRLRGEVIYPNLQAEAADRFLEQGQLVSLFAKDIDFAIQHPQVGSRPLLVKALRTYGDTRTEIVLNNEYASRIVELDNEGFFRDAGVIIVLD